MLMKYSENVTRFFQHEILEDIESESACLYLSRHNTGLGMNVFNEGSFIWCSREPAMLVEYSDSVKRFLRGCIIMGEQSYKKLTEVNSGGKLIQSNLYTGSDYIVDSPELDGVYDGLRGFVYQPDYNRFRGKSSDNFLETGLLGNRFRLQEEQRFHRQKETVNMTRWRVTKTGDHYNLSGTADIHPRLGGNVFIKYTSHLVAYHLKEDVLTYETRNTIYKCPLRHINMEPYEKETKKYRNECIHAADHSEDILDQIIAAAAKISAGQALKTEFERHILGLAKEGRQELIQKSLEEEANLLETVKMYEDCVYLPVSYVERRELLAYHLGNRSGAVMPFVQRSVVGYRFAYSLTKALETGEEFQLKFSYTPIGSNCVESYLWSENIKYAAVENRMQKALYFDGVKIEPGERKVIKLLEEFNHRKRFLEPFEQE